jgi:hypothetical protein
MEQLYSHIILNIILYLDFHSLLNFDTAVSNKDIRTDYLQALKMLKNHTVNYVSYWSNKRSLMLGKKQICPFYMLKYLSKDCKLLILNNGEYDRRYHRVLEILNIVNDHIDNLHIDLYNVKHIINTISGKSIVSIMLVNCVVIDIDKLIDNIKQMCPLIKKIQINNVYVLNTNSKINKIFKI